jgi:hypothetical protein
MTLQDEWRVILKQLAQLEVIGTWTGENETVHMATTQQSGATIGAIFKGDRCKEYLIIGGRGGIVNPSQNLGKKSISKGSFRGLTFNVGEDARLPRNEALSGDVGLIPQLLCGLEHSLARLLADPHAGDIVEDKGDRGPGDPGRFRYITRGNTFLHAFLCVLTRVTIIIAPV